MTTHPQWEVRLRKDSLYHHVHRRSTVQQRPSPVLTTETINFSELTIFQIPTFSTIVKFTIHNRKILVISEKKKRKWYFTKQHKCKPEDIVMIAIGFRVFEHSK